MRRLGVPLLILSRVCSCTVIAQRFEIANMKFEFAVQLILLLVLFAPAKEAWSEAR